MKARSTLLLDKSISAMLSAIEIYNKPVFEFREETFSILAVNAWELLLKSRILQLDSNHINSIIVFRRKQKANGQMSKKFYKQINRSGNYNTISIFNAYDKLINTYGDSIDPIIRRNLEILVEIRDNSIHFINKSFELQKKVLEIGTACVKNFVTIIRRWFGRDITKYNLMMMPIAFTNAPVRIELIPSGKEETRLVNLIDKIEKQVSDDVNQTFNFSLNIEINFLRKNKRGATEVVITNSPEAIPVILEEEDIRRSYPWDYAILVKQLINRYSNFRQTKKFHSLKALLEKQEKYCHVRLLDPASPNSTQKKFYSPGILNEFDKHYQKGSTKK